MNFIVLDEHPPEDGRIGRHIRYLLQNNERVFRLHFSLFDPTLESGHFSLYGEKGFRISPPSSHMRPLNFGVFNMKYLLPFCFYSRIKWILKELDIDLTAPAVLHVHDPCLLKIATMMKRKLFRSARIVYDRHEFYEVFNKRTQLPTLTRHRLYELLAEDAVDGVAHASLGGESDPRLLFPRAEHTHIPNFPLTDTYDEARIREKILMSENNSAFNLLYIGSLNPHDRDVRLMLKIAADILAHIPETTFFIGGPSYGNDEELQQMMIPLREKYGARFNFHLGYVGRNMAQRLTEDCHIGLLFIDPETTYWIKSSPNKLYEYLRCGAIPVMRASIESPESVSSCSLLFDRYTPEEEIVSSLRDLATDPERCRRMMEDALTLSAQFTFNTVGPEYFRLYNRLWNGRSSPL